MQKSEKAAGSLCKTGALILYALPVIFLVAAYFLMTVTSEDMLQGAGLGSGYIERFFQAFRYNSRLGDMYAWPAIRGFDYQFGFGLPDAFLRAADVLMGTAVVYLAAVLVLGGRPKLLLKDGTVFCLTAARFSLPFRIYTII